MLGQACGKIKRLTEPRVISEDGKAVSSYLGVFSLSAESLYNESPRVLRKGIMLITSFLSMIGQPGARFSIILT